MASTYSRRGGDWGPPKTKQSAGCTAVLLIAALAVALTLVTTALAIGAANSWIMEGNFVDGWQKSWERWPITLGWSIIAGFLVWNAKSDD